MLMANAPSVSVTTDAASMHTGDSHVAVPAHWLDPQWNVMSCVLGVSISNGMVLCACIYCASLTIKLILLVSFAI